MTPTEPTKQELTDTLKLLDALADHKRFNKMKYFQPYPPQKKYLDLGATVRERLFMAGNRSGKTETAGFETACHLTGDYPADWKGKRFDYPTKGWGASVSGLVARDVMQEKLCGEAGVVSAWGSGMIPKDAFVKWTLARGVSNALDTIQVRHKTNGIEDGVSTFSFKSYEQGPEKFQGAGIDFGWCDEMPTLAQGDVYPEFLTRLVEGGVMYITATPLLNTLVNRFTKNATPDQVMVQMTLDEAVHFSRETMDKMIAGWPAHERETRRRGVPMAGFGRIFPYDEALLKEPFIAELPADWVKVWGVDFGIAHPFAAVLLAWDRDNDVIHIVHCIRITDAQPINHAQAMKHFGANVPVAWPHDGAAREAGSGQPLSSLYKAQGLKMLPTHATFPDGGYSTEAGYAEMDQRMTTGRFKVAAHLSEWFEEFRFLHRDKNGMIEKVNDDLMSATRTGLIMRRFASQVQLGSTTMRRSGQKYATGIEPEDARDPWSIF